MGNLRKEIKKPTDEEKIRLYKDILIIMLNSGTILSYEEIQKMVNKDIGRILSQDEVAAIYSLAIQLQKYSLMGKFNEKIFEFLQISVDYDKMNIDNLMKFISATIEDIEEIRKYLPKTKWEMQTNKIFDRMEGKNPYADEMKHIKIREENIGKVEK